MCLLLTTYLKKVLKVCEFLKVDDTICSAGETLHALSLSLQGCIYGSIEIFQMCVLVGSCIFTVSI